MRKVKLLKCHLSRKGNRSAQGSETGNGNTRYVPVDIFNLWRHYMQNRHGFALDVPEVSYWVDDEALMEWAEQVSPDRLETVIELSFYAYSQDVETSVPVVRYIAADDYAESKDFLLRHYPSILAPPGLTHAAGLVERRGYFIRRKADN